MSELLNQDILYKAAEGLYKDCHYNAVRKTIEMLLDIDDSNIDHNIFYFKALIKIDGNLTGNDYINNLLKAEKQYDKLFNFFTKPQTDKFKDKKKKFFAMIEDYFLFKHKVYQIKNQDNTNY